MAPRFARRLLLAGVAIVCISTGTAAQQVFVLSKTAGPGVDFTQFDSAVFAVPAGSILLVKAGLYSGGTIDGKGLSVVAEAGAAVTLSVKVKNLPATQSVLLSGLRMTATSIVLQDNLGSVRLQGCDLPYGEPFDGETTLTLLNCAAVTLVDCTVTGVDAHLEASQFLNVVPAASALTITSSNAWITGGTYVGGVGNMTSSIGHPDGADAVVIHSGFLLVAGADLRGGNGGKGKSVFPGPPFGCVSPGDGGAGLRLAEGSPTVAVIDAVLAGGTEGVPVSGCVATGSDGSPTMLETGSLTSLTGDPATLDTNSPVREGQSVSITLGGTPGDTAFIALGVQPQFLYAAGLHGALGVQPLSILGLGTVPAGGTLTLSATLPPMGAALEGVVVQLQAVTSAGPGTTVLGQPAALVLLDSSL